MGDEPIVTEKKRRGRPPKKKDDAAEIKGQERMMRVIITPRQDRLLRKLRSEWGLSESEHIRRALDDYLRVLIERGDFKE